MQIGYHVLLLFEPLVNHDCGNSTHKGEWQMSLSQLDCTHMQTLDVSTPSQSVWLQGYAFGER